MKRFVLLIAVGVLALAFVYGRTFAQAPQSNDLNAALIRELHDLRLAIEKLASATSRVQMLTARASQQEQRISGMTSELMALNQKLADANADALSTNAAVEQLKERLRVESDPRQRAALESQQADIALEINRKSLRRASLQAQVDGLRQQLLAEQSNLSDLYRRLDDLDRSVSDSQK